MQDSSKQQQQQPARELTGRVVRLHFACHAAIPIGSLLRVTGSTLWAPGTAATDPADAAPAVGRAEQDAYAPVANEVEEAAAGGTLITSQQTALYTSSVEMVTTPDDYPIWRTRKPVVLVIHNSRRPVQHHYYRYLVVSPGGAVTSMLPPMELNSSLHGGGEGTTDDFLLESRLLVSTSDETAGSTPVMEWEDPFNTLAERGGTTRSGTAGEMSSVSLASSITTGQQVTGQDYRNLPYRTLDIDVKTGLPVLEDEGGGGGGDADGSGMATSVPTTTLMDGTVVRLDRWNMPDDASFRSYRIREALHQENIRKLETRLSGVSDRSDENMSQDAGTDEDEKNRSSGETSSAGMRTPPAFSSSNRVFFVCFHLPVVVVRNETTGEWNASWSESILAKTEGSQILNMYESFWVGTVTTHPPLTSEADKQAVHELLAQMSCIPIFLDPAVRQAHYYGFCKQVLWPAFHNIDLLDLSTCGWLTGRHTSSFSSNMTDDDAQAQQQQQPTNRGDASDWDQGRLDDWWKAYQAVNQEFCDKIAGLARPNDILWIHDYHLSLLPQMATSQEIQKFGLKATRKVMFLHIPFPTSQVFRELESGETILEGMLHADVVGFHAFDHARHFLNAAKRILGLNYESLVGGLIGVGFRGSTVLVTMSNVSIEPRMVDAVLMLPSVQAEKQALKAKHEGRIIIGGVDIGQRLSGTTLKLLAYERLLQDYPSWQPRVVLVERLLLPGSRKADEDLTKREVRALVKRIQDKFGSAVIDYQELAGTGLPMDQRLALWKASDVMMSTAIREGLNHWPMEYIFAHKEPETPGVVITSELSAVSSILNGALRVNPYDIPMSITTIDKALSMSLQEREGRRYRDIDFVSKMPSDKWVKNVLRDLKDATSRQQSATSRSEANSSVTTPYATPAGMSKSITDGDSTAAFLAREANLAFAHLNLRAVKRAYDASSRRVIILDFNGTIVMKEPPGKYLKREILGTSGNKPPPAVLDALSVLSRDPQNLIYVVSGDSTENVMGAMGQLPSIGLAVSNGASFSPPVTPGGTREWFTFDLGVDWDAVKRVALPVLSKYTARSNGSFVKLTSFSIGWSYYSCDPEWGSLQASHLVLELESELRAFDVRFVTLKGIVEVVPRKLNKGLIVQSVLRDTEAKYPEQGVDFVLCFGDDVSDEKMFTSVFSFLSEKGDESNSRPGPPVMRENGTLVEPPQLTNSSRGAIERPVTSFTVAVGKKPSHASTYVNDSQEVANCLVLLAKGEIPERGVPIWDQGSSLGLFET